jgi:RHS repeat-associated protein
MRITKYLYRSLIILFFLLLRFNIQSFCQISQDANCVYPAEPVHYTVYPHSSYTYEYYTVFWNIINGDGVVTDSDGDGITIKWSSFPATLACTVVFVVREGNTYVEKETTYTLDVSPAAVNLTNIIKPWSSTQKTAYLSLTIPYQIEEAVPIVSGYCMPTVTYKWYKSNNLNGPFTVIPGEVSSVLYFSSPLTETTYYRREITMADGSTFLSNIIKYELLPDISGTTCFDTYMQERAYTVNNLSDRQERLTSYKIEWSTVGGEVIFNEDATVIVRWYSYPASLTAHIIYTIYNGMDQQDNPMYDEWTEDLTLAVTPNSSMLPNVIKSATGKTSFSYSQVPDGLTESVSTSGQLTCSPPSYQWLSSTTPLGPFTPINGATGAQLNFSSPLQQTTYYKRAITASNGATSYSNVVKMELVSANWENQNYIREHTVNIPGKTDWKTVDQLTIGDKLQGTKYFDGIGRPTETISCQTATPENGATLWGDVVQFYEYDSYGRQLKQYLPYSTTVELGKYKTDPVNIQSRYYNGKYNEQAPYSFASYESSPLNRITNVKSPGTNWSTALGNSASLDLNNASDNIQIIRINYNTGLPERIGVFNDNTLYKTIKTDENNKLAIEYSNTAGQLICKKVQLDNSPTASFSGWICTYFVYDDLGQLRYEFQPEAVKWFDANGWSFSVAGAQDVVEKLCFRYEYDEKGRTTLKQAPGAKELRMIYDKRDRLVFTQDGNQRIGSEWTVSFFDALDRVTMTGLYKTTKTVSDLVSAANNSVTYTPATVNLANVSANYLEVPTRDVSKSVYKAAISVTLLPGFESVLNDAFSVEIDPSMVVYTTSGGVVYSDPVPAPDVNDPSKFTALKYSYYDNYNYTGAKAFDNNFNNTLAYASSTTVEPISKTDRTTGMVTGTKVRVLGTNTFLLSTFYYDDKGRGIQTLGENIKSGTDIITAQYHWDGRLLSSETRHSASGTVYSGYSVLTKYNHDLLGRVEKIEKKYGTNGFKTILAYKLDDMGRLKTKDLDPGYTGSGKSEMESLTYSYNIHNQITGINKDYALKTPGVYSKWDNFFGLCLGYDKLEGVFSNTRLDDLVAGQVWTTQGDDAQRKYDYTYDNAGRLINAAFKEYSQSSGGWTNAKMDFSVTGTNGKIEYDLNGNLKYMIHKGIIAGSQAPVNIDDLRYTYETIGNSQGNSNKLIKVIDNSPLAANNGKFGDFTDGSNGTNDDYVYDDNGNLVIDLNKNIKDLAGPNGIKYNYLDKPEEIKIVGKGTIKIIYNANGTKLQKIFTPDGSTTSIVTSYINEYVYRGDDLQYINFEEGRIRVMEKVDLSNSYGDFVAMDGNMDLPGTKRGVYDFFIRDYQGNVRMIVTEETHSGRNVCTMETENGRNANEEPVFGQVDANGTPTANNEVKARFSVASIPGQSIGEGWQNSAIGSYVSQLGNLARKVGPNAFLKVMAGDEVSAEAIYYYQNPVTNQKGGPSFVSDVLVSLAQAISGSPAVSGITKTAATDITNQLNTSLPFQSMVDPDANNDLGNNPKAYLAILYFDERFNLIEEGSETKRVSQSGNGASPLVLAKRKAPKNGYALVYVCNESDEMVYFDNLQVRHDRGRIIEENHYYVYGLKIAGISSRKLADAMDGAIDNKYLYNDKELIDDADLDWYDYGFRNYDPQIGRFPQLDPLAFEYPYYTPYQYAGCEPIANIDLDGLEEWKVLESFTFVHKVRNLVPSIVQGIRVISEAVRLGGIESQGAVDAWANASSVGLFDFLGGDKLDNYSTLADKIAYLNGKLKGYYNVKLQAAGEMGAGGGALLTTGWTGVGAAVSGTVALHGLAVEATADIQISKTQELLNNLKVEYAYTSSFESNNPPDKSDNSSSDKTNSVDVAYDGKTVPVYRGGNDFTVKPGDIKIDKETGLVKTTHGVSLEVHPANAEKFGTPYKIESIPKGLKIEQRGQRLDHFEIMPAKPMKLEEFQMLLNQVKVSPLK